MEDNYYELLGVSNTATQAEIKAAYKRMAQKHHPDKHDGDIETSRLFTQIQEAYAVLSDAVKRSQYDEYGHLGINVNINISKEAAMFIESKFVDFILALENIDSTDVIKEFIKNIDSAKKGADIHLHTTQEQIDKLEKTKSKLIRKGSGENLLANVVQRKIDTSKAQLFNINNAINISNAAIELLNEYEYEFTRALESTNRVWNERPTFNWRGL